MWLSARFGDGSLHHANVLCEGLLIEAVTHNCCVVIYSKGEVLARNRS
jgi:hypothetical protein